ncbi:hypothetical protein Q4E93_04280 [Flavitalea sp. BT771]|uniref:hypothetical protein n=1 Tax=Flavitalea sp. BT771 TaxID=3063329 RepID=UPI0026E12157|nr:hypothetical protein [Flavitalea sp. BT771]MDO6429786.1 hypothetical protein [Flavitalea sp. BT771]MDV6218086.1 hypothetical protein [Flavitalea sp. BT771]
MGRQIQICTTDDDNLVFEGFLKQNFDCVFFQPSAPTAEKLIIESFTETSHPFSSQIFIWNKAFPWTPAFELINTVDRQYYYLSNTRNAPLIEFSKTIPNHVVNGRIYWSKFFLSDTLLYNVEDFEKFYLSVTKWIIKNATGKIKYMGINTYYLGNAWSLKIETDTKAEQ